MEDEGREIFLCFISTGKYVGSCTRSHAPVQGNKQYLVIRYIRVAREAMDPYRKRDFDGGGDRGSHRGHWYRIGGHGQIKSEGQHHRNDARFGGGQGCHSGGRDGNNGGGGGARGGHGSNTNPSHQEGQKNWGGGQDYREGSRSA